MQVRKMYWSFIVVHILIIAVTLNDSFPIELKEIDEDDIYLVDKARKGRFIQVNQTTLLPNPIELIRAKKSSNHNEKKSDETSAFIPDDIKIERKALTTTDENHPPKAQPYAEADHIAQNNFTYASDSLFEPQTFGYPSFFEDHFYSRADDHAKSNFNNFQFPIQMLTSDGDCCNVVDQLMGTVSGNLPCIDEYLVPEENYFC